MWYVSHIRYTYHKTVSEMQNNASLIFLVIILYRFSHGFKGERISKLHSQMQETKKDKVLNRKMSRWTKFEKFCT